MLAATAPDAELVLPRSLRLTPEQFALVCEANPDAVLELLSPQAQLHGVQLHGIRALPVTAPVDKTPHQIATAIPAQRKAPRCHEVGLPWQHHVNETLLIGVGHLPLA